MTSMSVNSGGGGCLPPSLDGCSPYMEEEEEEEEQVSRGYPESMPRSERSEEDFDGERTIEKRLSSDSLHGTGKKRRKQSNPVKIRPSVESSKPSEPPHPLVSSSADELQETRGLRCPYCPQAFPDEGSFSYHIKVDHVRKMLSDDAAADHKEMTCRDVPLNLSSQKNSPVAYDRRSQNSSSDPEELLQSRLSLPPNYPNKLLSNFLPFGAPPFLLPFLSQQASVEPGISVSSSGESALKIFNPEAYCGLCNKEFCNKYFLKTHKANKHGVYSDMPNSDAGSTLQAAGQYQDTSLIGPERPPTTSADHSSPSGESHDSGRPSSESDRLAASSQSGLCCDVCQKEFCDAFHLHRHRVSVHENSDPEPETADMPQNLVKQTVYNEGAKQYKESIQQYHDPYDAGEFNESDLSQALQRSLSHESDGNLKYNYPESMVNNMTDSSEAPKHFSQEQMRHMGVINADAFCNICCKEFCNKYFLKVHKYKRHAIGSPPPERSNWNGSSDLNVECPPLERLLEAPIKEGGVQDCDLCGRPFQSSYLLQMHKYYFHGFGHQSSNGPNQAERAVHRQRSKSVETDKAKEHFSQDLQKLQGMITGLKDKKEDGYKCSVCGKRAENPYLLQAHLLKDHGLISNQEELTQKILMGNLQAENPYRDVNPLLNKQVNGITNTVSPPQKAPQPYVAETVCTVCKKDCFAPFFLQQHMSSVHGIQSSPMNETAFLARIRREVECQQKKPERPKPASTSRSYCEICNKELCNKYFMKTHMIKMHGINMDNHQSPGVKCDVCQKEVSSSYFLKVHKQNTHGIYDPEDDRVLRENGVPKDEEGLEICKVCSGKFKTLKLLECHMQSEHGAAKEKKGKSPSGPTNHNQNPLPSVGPSCSFCGLTLPDILSLRLHLIQAHPLQEQKRDDSAGSKQAGDASRHGGKLLAHPFSSFSAHFPPFLRPERMLGLLPQLNSVSMLEPSTTVASTPAATVQFPSLDLPPGVLSQQFHNLTQSFANTKNRETGSTRKLSSEAKDPQPTPKKEILSSIAGHKKTASNKKYFSCRICRRRFIHRAAFLYHWHEKHIVRSFEQVRGVGGFYRRRYRCRSCGFTSRRRLAIRRHVFRRHQPRLPRVTGLPLVAADSHRYQMQSLILSMPDAEGSADPAAGVLVPAHVTLPVSSRLLQRTELLVSLLPA